MLSRLESVYLAILRVAILVAASLALLVTVLVATASAPSLLASAGIGAADAEGGVTLGRFMDEQRDAATTGEAADAGIAEAEVAIDPDLVVAARNFAEYLGGRDDARKRDFALALQRNADRLSSVALESLGVDGAAARYGKSIRAVSRDLLESTGRKLSERRVWALIEWHHERFVAELAAGEAQRAAARADLMMKLGIAGAAFLAFVLIVFVFLFVKIERNLRGVGALAPLEPEPA